MKGTATYTNLQNYHFLIPDSKIVAFISKQKSKRIVLTLRKDIVLHLALQRSKQLGHFFYLNQKTAKLLNKAAGEAIKIEVVADESEFQAPFNEVFNEVINSDEAAKKAFSKLTDGSKRAIIFTINRYKMTQTQIDKSLNVCIKLKMGIKDLRELFKN